jgi:NTP pyrophosphatase (non-canonical NTP hydrolase)
MDKQAKRYKAQKVYKRLIGQDKPKEGRVRPDMLTNEYEEYLEALESGNKPDIEEELQDVMFAAQLLAYHRTGDDRPMLGADQKIKEFYNRRDFMEKVMKKRKVPFNTDHLSGGTNWKKPHKVTGAFALAGHELPEEDASAISKTWTAKHAYLDGYMHKAT